MALNNYLIEGLSGTGKTIVCEELARQGYNTIDADEVFGFYGDPKTGFPTEEEAQLNWLWDKEKVEVTLGDKSVDKVFICGGAMNQEKFKHHFKQVFTLRLDDETLRKRLLSRTNNEFGKKPEDLARQLEWNKGVVDYSKQRGTTLIDASQSIESVVKEILSHL